MLFNCKFCGGELDITDGAAITKCKYCHTSQTLPKTTDNGTHNLFNRATALRLRCEFDKAEAVYEKILEADATESEAYWGLILCRYGIEYVEDPATKTMLPTCHRASYESVIADGDYKAAIDNADGERRKLYEEQAREIDRIQKDILALARDEETYDVFICYKESDENGKRTRDSVIANDIYYQLTEEGFKVFYAAITLEGKLGAAYEPIIFAALNSAKVMLAVGTKPEYFNAVWVKNEWSRYLKIIKKDRNKLLIPCYQDMDAYDLPDEFAHLQAQDMSKIGFITDIVRGIKKIIKKDEPKPSAVVKEIVKETVVKESTLNDGGVSTEPLLKRAFMFLEDGDFKSADEYCERVLDLDPENTRAYLGKLMAELKVKKKDDLKSLSAPFSDNVYYKKVIRFADESLKTELLEYTEHIIYTQAVKAMRSAKTETDYKKAAELFKPVSDYSDAAALSEQCLALAEKAKQQAEEKKRAEELAKSIAEAGRRKKAEEARLARERKAEAERIAARKRARRKKLIVTFTSLAVCLAIAFAVALNTVILPTIKTNEFISAYGQSVYDKFGLVAKGEYITFGKYEQDASDSNGREDIEWLVLDVQDGKALVVSRYGLDWKQYHSDDHGTWETSNIRKWLNETFFTEAFSEDEQALIPLMTVSADSTSNSNEKNTEDKVFLLSHTETATYLSKKTRKCERTAYATSRGAYEYKHNLTNKNNCIWWLRTSVGDEAAYCIDLKGEDYSAYKAAQFAVRPAIWIDIKA